jgi:2-keto-4-pentenoate hydratase
MTDPNAAPAPGPAPASAVRAAAALAEADRSRTPCPPIRDLFAAGDVAAAYAAQRINTQRALAGGRSAGRSA